MTMNINNQTLTMIDNAVVEASRKHLLAIKQSHMVSMVNNKGEVWKVSHIMADTLELTREWRRI
jgi:hypothetical protein